MHILEQAIDNCLEYDILENIQILEALDFVTINIEKGEIYAQNYKKAAHHPNQSLRPIELQKVIKHICDWLNFL